jgi:hypothetical protein
MARAWGCVCCLATRTAGTGKSVTVLTSQCLALRTFFCRDVPRNVSDALVVYFCQLLLCQILQLPQA